LGYLTSDESAAVALEEIEAGGSRGHIARVDVSDDESVSGFVDDTATRYGRLDVVVNSAGRWTSLEETRFEGTNSEAFSKLLDVDLLGTYRVCKAGLKYLRTTGNGSIVNFGTAYGPGLNPDNHINSLTATYCATKAAIRAFTCALARDIAPEVRANTVSPGLITVDFNDEILKEVLAATPLKRVGLPAHIAEAVLYLASDGAAFTTGQVIEVSGGWTVDW
jgi:3-oxoacyl-[acyl-carrier protein] reductase